MEDWKEVKKLITLNKKPQWTDVLHEVYHNFNMRRQELDRMTNGGNLAMRDAWAWHAAVMEEYDVRKDYNNVVSIKLVMPEPCQAKCRFCFMNAYRGMLNIDHERFLKNYLNSLGDVVSELYGKHPISLDITGGEPTFDRGLLIRVLKELKQSRWLDKINRVVLTTNGYQLDDVINYLPGVVDYVNISTHHFNYEIRKNIFGTVQIPDSDELHSLVVKLLRKGIRTSTVAVIDKPINDFAGFLREYLQWAKCIGFESVRFRGDCSSGDFAPTFNKYIDDTISSGHYIVIQEENTNDSHWCRLVTRDGYFFFMLQGVQSTYECSRGVEYIISFDGLPYLDYYHQHSFYDNDLPVEYIFDKKKIPE